MKMNQEISLKKDSVMDTGKFSITSFTLLSKSHVRLALKLSSRQTANYTDEMHTSPWI